MEKKERPWGLAILALLAVGVCYPVGMVLTGAFRAQWELEESLGPVFLDTEGSAKWSLLPMAPSLASLVELLLDSPAFFRMFWNSVAISAGTLLGQLAVDVPAAWALARFRMRGKRWILRLYTAWMLMPFQVLMLPQYLVLRQLGMLDTLWAVILPGIFSTFPVMLLYRYFQGIPGEILEAARLDGAGEGTILLRIGIPMGMPGILAAGILSFLDVWNLIEQPMTFLKTKSKWPLSLFLPEMGLKELGLGFGAAFLMLVPALLAFLGCQKELEQGIALSGGKD